MLPSVLEPLTQIPHWLVWKWETTAQGKPTKVPYQARDPARKASHSDPATWATYDEAVAAAPRANGIGFVLTDTNIAAFDIDDCRHPTSGAIHSWAQELVNNAANYTEVTVSGTGLRIIGHGDGDAIHRKLQVADGVSCEIYRKAKRYIVMTGNQIGDRPLANLDPIMESALEQLDRRPQSGTTTQDDDNEDKLWDTVRTGGDFPDRSRGVWFVINEMLRRGYNDNLILTELLNRSNAISAHIYDQSNPNEYAKRQINEAKKQLDFTRNTQSRKPLVTQSNIRIAFVKLKVSFRYDQFSDRTYLYGLPGFGPVVDDAAMVRLRLTIDQRWHFLPSKDMLHDVVGDVAHLNGFHPVRDYLDGLTWDGVERLDKWLITYGGATDSPYVRAVGALLLIAAVRRVRVLGCKFDEMVVLESEQGTNKSSALQVLAINDEWFSDNLPLNLKGKEVIEALRGHWIIEAAELSGMRKVEVEHLKAFLSRQIDRARMSYGRTTTEAPRQCVIAGTTNHFEYLRDQTGNRRFWPLRIACFDLEMLKRDRDQLWAEASKRERESTSIRLDQSLWNEAAQEQLERTVTDPYVETLATHLSQFPKGKISSEDVWTILDLRGGQRTQEHNFRLGAAMRELGWRRPNKSSVVRVNGELVVGYVKGDPPWPSISVSRDEDGNLSVCSLMMRSSGPEEVPF
jgi:predicted P-loop ATPase